MSIPTTIWRDVSNLETTLRVLMLGFNDTAAAPVAQVALEQQMFAHRGREHLTPTERMYDQTDLALRMLPTLPVAEEDSRFSGLSSRWHDLPQTRVVVWSAIVDGMLWAGESMLAHPPGMFFVRDGKRISMFEECARTLLKKTPLSPNERNALDQVLRKKLEKISLNAAKAVGMVLKMFATEAATCDHLAENFEEGVIRQFWHCVGSRGSLDDLYGLLSWGGMMVDFTQQVRFIAA